MTIHLVAPRILCRNVSGSDYFRVGEYMYLYRSGEWIRDPHVIQSVTVKACQNLVVNFKRKTLAWARIRTHASSSTPVPTDLPALVPSFVEDKYLAGIPLNMGFYVKHICRWFVTQLEEPARVRILVQKRFLSLKISIYVVTSKLESSRCRDKCVRHVYFHIYLRH